MDSRIVSSRSDLTTEITEIENGFEFKMFVLSHRINGLQRLGNESLLLRKKSILYSVAGRFPAKSQNNVNNPVRDNRSRGFQLFFTGKRDGDFLPLSGGLNVS